MSAGGRHRTTVDDRTWRKLLKTVKGFATIQVKVGIVGRAAQANHTSGISLVELAAIHEYGAPGANIPARSYIGKTLRDRVDEWRGMQLRLVKALLSGKVSAKRAQEILGLWAATAIKHTIASGSVDGPPLRPETIRRKGSSKPLVDTAQLLNAISWAPAR